MARKRPRKDPYAAREAAKYERPIPSRELIMEVLAERGAPAPFGILASDLGIEDDTRRQALARRLGAMERDGQVIRNRREGYGLVSKMDLVRGRVSAHPDGFGFLIPDDGGKDLFLPPRQMRGLMHGDRVVARVTGIDEGGRKAGAVVETLERSNRYVVGRFFYESGVAFVSPDNKRIHQDIVVPADSVGAARDGDIVVAEIVEQPSKRARPVGRITEVLGEHMAPGMEIDVAIRVHGLPTDWPAGLQAEIAGLPDEVPETAKRDRVDLRGIALVTIDGEDARDFDDAVYCEPTPKGWRLVVAIADVSAYVANDTELDAEAHSRGTSVYFPGRVVPMLPEVLSNGLCSLNPGVDRLCMACELLFNADGKPIRSRFFEAVMRSQARLTYTEVAAAVVERDSETRQRLGALAAHLDRLYSLYRVLRQARQRRGAIDFETTETRIVFGPGKKIDSIQPLVRNEAHQIIEECMVAANVAAARFLLRRKLPTLYRVHDGPAADRVANVRAFLAELGLRLGGGAAPEAGHYAALIARVGKRPEAHLIHTVLLRSLAQAVYAPENIGHFGLALDCYTHFTSPIRRYPDLLVHRAIRHLLNGGSRQDFPFSPEQMVELGEHCSMTERRADEATRDAIDWLKCEFMLDKVGEVFRGVVSAVTSFGLFVVLDEVYAEGLVHISALGDDYYHFDPVHHRLEGERSRRVHRLADRISVQVVRVDLDERKIDLEPADGARGGGSARSRSRSLRRRRR